MIVLLAAGWSQTPSASSESDSAAETPDRPTETVDDFEPPPDLEPGWYARIETTKGRILARLLPEQAPQSVAHFVALARGTFSWTDLVTGETVTDRYYDGMPIHTVVAGRLFETGDAGSLGRAMPSVYVPPEGFGPIDFSRRSVLAHTRMGGGRISGVKFFVTASPAPWLYGENPIFGIVVEGAEVVFNISQVRTYSNRKPIEDLFVEKIRIFAVGEPAPLPEPEPYTPERIEIEFSGSDGPK
jgi:peptidyl-prolyl cis-trans isomerase A (cyclophilin A)